MLVNAFKNENSVHLEVKVQAAVLPLVLGGGWVFKMSSCSFSLLVNVADAALLAAQI